MSTKSKGSQYASRENGIVRVCGCAGVDRTCSKRDGVPCRRRAELLYHQRNAVQLSFDDTFEFTIPQNGTGSGSISTSFSSLSNKLTITDLLINGVHFVVPSNGSGQFLAVSGINIISGVMNTIEVIGTTSSKGGTYSGTATFSAAVPETATWAMMLGGFGLMGAAMRRRRTNLTFA